MVVKLIRALGKGNFPLPISQIQLGSATESAPGGAITEPGAIATALKYQDLSRNTARYERRSTRLEIGFFSPLVPRG
jgi:hypothetical protein